MNQNATIADLKAQYRDWLIARLGGSEVLADTQIRAEQEAATAQREREAVLRDELATIRANVAAHNAKTSVLLAPLHAQAEQLQAAAAAAWEELEAARIAREQECFVSFRRREAEIVEELSRPHGPSNRFQWRRAETMEGGSA